MSTNNQLEIIQLFGGLEPSDSSNSWFVIHTKPRWEKKFASYCQKNAVNYYLPLYDSVREYNNRKVMFKIPLFSGYIFVKCSPADKSLLLRSGSIVRFIKVPDEEELLYDLSNIYQSLNKNVPFTPHAFVKEGYTVQIINGPYAGIEGLVIDANYPGQVIVGIHLIQQAICIKVNPADVELITRTPQEDY
jgi:transcription antitermination factor NusG